MITAIANTMIDAIQEGKKTFVSTFVKHDPLAQVLEQFVDAQTKYTKEAVATSIDVATKLAKLTTTKEYFGGK